MAVEQDRDKLAFKFKLAVDKGNAAALVSFLVFDAIADTKIRKHEPDGLTDERRRVKAIRQSERNPNGGLAVGVRKSGL